MNTFPSRQKPGWVFIFFDVFDEVLWLQEWNKLFSISKNAIFNDVFTLIIVTLDNKLDIIILTLPSDFIIINIKPVKLKIP